MAKPVQRSNREIVKSYPSVLSDVQPAGDAHHWPISRGRQAGDGLLEMLPLTREEHDRAQENDPWTLTFLETNARRHLVRIFERYRFDNRYLGPPELVAKVREWAEEDRAQRGVRQMRIGVL